VRILIAGIVGGLILFAWGAISHMATPLGHMGLANMAPDREAAVVAAMKGAMSERRIYMFPGIDMNDPKAVEEPAYLARVASGPTGLVIYNPGRGSTAPERKALAIEFTMNVIECLIAAFIVAQLAPSVTYARCVVLVTLIGLSGALMVDGSYWNWYKFPDDYFLAQLAMNTLGASAAGLAIAGIARPK
jgi:hypothetical protein